MNILVYHIDAFTQTLFHGNPAAVCPLPAWLPDDQMQALAAENNLAETAFFVERGDQYDLRWFTPAIEVDLCGHATLATAHVIFQYLKPSLTSVEFSTKSGILTVAREDSRLSLDFPARPAAPCELPDELVKGLGAVPQEVLLARDYLAVYASEEFIRTLRPNLAALAQLDCLGIIATAPGQTVDFVSRFFAPQAGIPEDPVTGSAHCTLVPYWSQKLGKTRLHALQVSPRGGELFCEDRGARVSISGYAVTYSEGCVHL